MAMTEAARERWTVRLAFGALIISLFALGVTYLQWRSAERAADIADHARIDANNASAAALAVSEHARQDAVAEAERQRADAQLTLTTQRNDAAAALDAQTRRADRANTLADRSAKAAEDTATTATKAANTAHDALLAQTRPWLGIDRDPNLEDTEMAGVFLRYFKLRLRNYSQFPALGLIKLPVFLYIQVPKPEVRYFDDLHICETVDDTNWTHNTLSWSLKRHGYVDVVFPGADGIVTQEVEIISKQGGDLPDLGNGASFGFILGCLAYDGPNGSGHYHTRLMYQVWFSDLIVNPDGTKHRNLDSISRIFYDPQ
jgi:hypothetical protein